MRHIPFLRVLADSSEEVGLQWDIVALGYLSLRSLDVWVDMGPVGFVNDEATHNIRRRVEALPVENPYKSIFNDIAHTLINAPDWNVSSVSGPLLAYADMLERESLWSLGADAYRTISDSFERFNIDNLTAAQTASHARIRQGYCLRSAGKLDQAEGVYSQALLLARQFGDSKNIHLSRIGLAAVYRAKGNLPKSIEAITALLNDWKRGLFHVPGGYSRILQARAATYHEMQDYDGAILDYFAAYKGSTDEVNRQSILGDLGACCIRKGYFDLANTVLNLVLHRSDRAIQKQFTILNLLYLAITRSDKVGFEYYKRMWEPELCGDMLNAHAYLFLAEGAEKFSTSELAIQAYQKAASFAEQTKIHKVQFDAIQRLSDIQTMDEGSTLPVQPSEAVVPADLTEVASSLQSEYLFAIG